MNKIRPRSTLAWRIFTIKKNSFSTIQPSASISNSEEDEDSGLITFAVGDLIELKRRSKKHLGLVTNLDFELRKATISQRDGQSITSFFRDIIFHSPKFYQEPSLENNAIFSHLAAFTTKVNGFLSRNERKMGALIGTHLKTATFTPLDVAKLVTKKDPKMIKLEETYSCFRYLISNLRDYKVVAFNEKQVEFSFMLRPLDEVKKLEMVFALGKSQQRKFQEKCKSLLNNSSGATFYEKNDQLLLDSIWEIASENGPLESPHIDPLKSLFDSLSYFRDSGGAEKLLRSLGVLRPWDHIDSLKTIQTFSTRQQPALIEKSLDLCERYRHDFGMMECWTIDEPDIADVDDAISIERRSGETDFWLHVHISDPTIDVFPGTDIFEYVMRKAVTSYLAERNLPMLPLPYTEKFSLEPGRDNPTLTTSIKICGKSYGILDYKIRPGIIRNVRKWNYADLNGCMKGHIESKDLVAPLEPEIPHPNSNIHSFAVRSDMEDRISDIECLVRTLEKFRRDRACGEDPVIQLSQYRGEPKLDSTTAILSPEKLYLRRNPTSVPNVRIKLAIEPFSLAHQVVSELMIMAGSVMAKIASESNIPIVFRTQESIFNWKIMSESERVSLQQLIASSPQQGFQSMKNSLKMVKFMSPSAVSSVPGRHAMLGLDFYCQGTSPLRRISDLLTHWQLKCMFREQKQLIDPTQFQQMISDAIKKEKANKRLQRANGTHWTRLFMYQERKRSLEQGNSDGGIFQGYVSSRSQTGIFEIFIPKLGFNVRLPEKFAPRDLQVDKWVKIGANCTFPLHSTSTMTFEIIKNVD